MNNTDISTKLVDDSEIKLFEGFEIELLTDYTCSKEKTFKKGLRILAAEDIKEKRYRTIDNSCIPLEFANKIYVCTITQKPQ